jgi:hypothetical protein
LGVEFASSLFGNRTSNLKEKLAQDMKLNAKMPKETEKETYQRLKLANQRVGEEYNAMQYLDSIGYKDPKTMKNIWLDYNQDMPIAHTNEKTGRVVNLPNNINTFEQYANSVKSNGRIKNFHPDPTNLITMYSPEGDAIPVHRSQVQNALKQGLKYAKK